MKPAVHVTHAHTPQNVSLKGFWLDPETGEAVTGEVMMKPLHPKHDPALGVYYLDVDGNRWKPLDGNHILPNGSLAGGPGWFTPLVPTV
jgi:hypothetical protein